jgi:hypothetical protein
VAKRLAASIVINGDGWNSTPAPLSLAASEGRVYQSFQKDSRPFVNFDKSGAATIRNNNKDLHNTVSGTRYMVRNGVKQSGTSTAWSTRHPRTAAGVRRSGEIILLVVDGRTTISAGVTLHQLASLLFDLGAVDGLELDGGGSSAMWSDGRIVNVPSDGKERPVINHIVLKSKKETVKMKYEARTIYTGTRIRPNSNTGQTELSRIANAGTVIFSNELFTATKALKNSDGVVYQQVGDKWLKVTMNGVTGWVAVTHMGQPICDNFKVLDDSTPPPPAEQPPIEVNVRWDGSKYILTVDGKNVPLP